MSTSFRPEKHLFVTTGATAPFEALIEASLSQRFLFALYSQGFTHLTVQAGDALETFRRLLNERSLEQRCGLCIEGFAFNQKGLGEEMRCCQAWQEGEGDDSRTSDSKRRVRGCVVSHAGTGSILDAMRLELQIIVVPNTSLLDNHQEDLATELMRQGYVTKSDIPHLAEALDRAMELQQAKTTNLRPASIGPILDKVLGFEDDDSARLD